MEKQGKEEGDPYHRYGRYHRNICRYGGTLPIVSFSLKDFDAMPIAFIRFGFGGRWFDVVVDNNARREYLKKRKR